MYVDKYGNVIKASAEPTSSKERVDALLTQMHRSVTDVEAALKDERYGHSIIQNRKQFLGRRVTELEAEIGRLNEKVERYKEGAAINAFRSKEYAKLERRYNTLQKECASTTRENSLLRDEIKEIKNPDFQTLGDLRSRINLMNLELTIKERRIEELQKKLNTETEELRDRVRELHDDNLRLTSRLEKIRDATCD